MANDPPFLDVEDDEQRQDRIGTLLERLDTTSSSSSVLPNLPLNIGREPVPGPVKPLSDSRVRAFLPAISASNEALSEQKSEDIDIENVPEDEEQYIEMNLGLGVLEAKPRPRSGSRSTSPSSDVESEPTSDTTSSESDSDSESSRSSSEDDSDRSFSSANDDSDAESQLQLPVNMKVISSRPLKPLPRAKIEA